VIQATEMILRERHEQVQREVDEANARRLAAARAQHTNRPDRLRFLGRR
jgi:hypothetical protein